jgi:hypothetical protein
MDRGPFKEIGILPNLSSPGLQAEGLEITAKKANLRAAYSNRPSD